MAHNIISPVNGLIVSWGYQNIPFPKCALPKELRLKNCEAIRNYCKEDVILDEDLSQTDYFVFIPEVGLGIPNFNPDVASSLIRDAAIEFCKRSKCLQRKFRLYLDYNIHEYPLQSIPEERPIDILCAMSTDFYRFDRANIMLDIDASLTPMQTLSISSRDIYRYNCDYIDVVLATSPKEDSVQCDIILYEEWKKAIVLYARRKYIENLAYSNDRLLQLTANNMQEFTLEVARAKDKVNKWLYQSNRDNYSGDLWS